MNEQEIAASIAPTPIVKVYHCNDAFRVNQYLENKTLIISEEEGSWLGTGMYFWDNLSNANYWKKEKKRKDNSRSYIISSNYIALDDARFIDLTDNDIAITIEKSWRLLAKTLQVSPDVTIGRKLNLLHKHFNFFDVIKVAAVYPKMRTNIFFNTIPGEERPMPTNNTKIIYLLKTDENIKEPIIIEEKEEEMVT